MESHSDVVIRTLVLRIQELGTLVRILQFKRSELDQSTLNDNFSVNDRTPDKPSLNWDFETPNK